MGRERGQAAVESALVLPLVVFCVLGCLQLFMMLQARMMAEYAVFRAVRAGSTHYGDCQAMNDAAIGALLPTIGATVDPNGGGGASTLVDLYKAYRGNSYPISGKAVVWIARELPEMGSVPDPEDKEFDKPGNLMRLETRMVYWFRLRIPFADWVMSRSAVAAYGLEDYTAANPLLETQTAAWGPGGRGLQSAIGGELRSRVANGEYVFPILTSWSMRMMTPARKMYFSSQNCPPCPGLTEGE